MSFLKMFGMNLLRAVIVIGIGGLTMLAVIGMALIIKTSLVAFGGWATLAFGIIFVVFLYTVANYMGGERE